MSDNSKEQARALAALQRGELVQLLAEVDTHRLDPRALEAAQEQYEKKHWARRVFAALLGIG